MATKSQGSRSQSMPSDSERQFPILQQLAIRSELPRFQVADASNFSVPASGIELVPSLTFSAVIDSADRQLRGDNDETLAEVSISTVCSHDNFISHTELNRISATHDTEHLVKITATSTALSVVLPDCEQSVFEPVPSMQAVDSRSVCTNMSDNGRDNSAQHDLKISCISALESERNDLGGSFKDLCNYATAMQTSAEELLAIFEGCTIQEILQRLSGIAELSRAEWTVSLKPSRDDSGLIMRIERLFDPDCGIAPLRVPKDRSDSIDAYNDEREAKTWARSLRARSCDSAQSERWNAALLPCVSVKTLPSRSILRKSGTSRDFAERSIHQRPTVSINPSCCTSPDNCVAKNVSAVEAGLAISASGYKHSANAQEFSKTPSISDDTDGKMPNHYESQCLKPRSSYQRLVDQVDPALEGYLDRLPETLRDNTANGLERNAQELMMKTSFERMPSAHELQRQQNMPMRSLMSNKAFRTTSFESLDSELFVKRSETYTTSAAKTIPCGSRSPSLDSTAASDVATTESLLKLELKDEISLVLKDFDLSHESVPPLQDICTSLNDDLPQYDDSPYLNMQKQEDLSASDNSLGTAFTVRPLHVAIFKPHSTVLPRGSSHVPVHLLQLSSKKQNTEVLNQEISGDRLPVDTPMWASGPILVGKGQFTARENVSPVIGSRRRQKMSSPFSSSISKLKNLERRKPEKNIPSSPTKSSVGSGTLKWFASLRSPTKNRRPSTEFIAPLSPFDIGMLRPKNAATVSSKSAGVSWLRSWTVRGKSAKAVPFESHKTRAPEELSGMCFEDGPFVDVERDESFNRRWFDRLSNHHNKL
ncbi:protein of unknown function [Taphrina deformans PYCC 5710]|uniref:Uncharacterized protein n=1 Tax=Taphrina deformans (strain PYCC 5710 / ATCC 11124 / CBS 356.35 / IMI 108563 / JCM 9778 / NBRC 8474) TaxID=1097556 RepID=R4XF46_TAPDE|nr:protein of unknown function [Taphrina deformans PYCC 5710]|eukprot:CCG84268.1 protein of unknown function [Taphrina deformans PYCC 5710]